MSLGLLFWEAGAYCEQRKLKTDTSGKVDAVLVMDASGSMRLTDPQRLREEGARLFTQFLNAGDRLAIVQFDKSATTVRPLGDYDPSKAEEVAADIKKVGDSGIYTDLHAAVVAAKNILEANRRDGATPVIVLLSDGKMDPDPAVGTAKGLADDLWNNVVPDLRVAGIKIDTLYFSEQADKDFLKQLAVATDGFDIFAETAENIHSSFAQLFLAVKKPQVLPLTSKGFKIDSAVDEATFYINRDGDSEIALITPKGVKLTAVSNLPQVKWFKGKKFDVVTVSRPEVGEWGAQGLTSSDGFATVLTNLKLESSWPASIFSGSAVVLQARLYEGEKPIELPEMTGEIRYGVQIIPTDRVSEPVIKAFMVDDGINGDAIAHDGIFSYRVTLDDSGEYKLSVVAKAPTFERSQQIPFRVRPRLVSLTVGEAFGEAEEAAHGSAPKGGGHGDAHGSGGHDAPDSHDDGISEGKNYIKIQLSDDAARFKEVEVKLVAIDTEKKRYVLPVKTVGGDNSKYQIEASVLPHDGEYKLQAVLTAEAKKNTKMKEMSQVVTYTKSPHEGEGAKVLVLEHDEKPKVEAATPAWIFYLLLTLVNAGLAGAGFVMIKKMGGPKVIELPAFEPTDEIVATLTALEEMAARTSIPFDDPIFTDAQMEFKVRSGAGAPSAGGSEAPPPPPPAESEESEDAAEESSEEEAALPEESAEAPPSEEEGA